MDDGGIVGPTDLLLKVWEILKAEGPPLGLVLNPTKCEWSWLDPKCTVMPPGASGARGNRKYPNAGRTTRV